MGSTAGESSKKNEEEEGEGEEEKKCPWPVSTWGRKTPIVNAIIVKKIPLNTIPSFTSEILNVLNIAKF